MNRAQRIAAALQIAEDFKGKLVDFHVDGAPRPVAALKARKTKNAVELMLSHAYRGEDGSPQVGLRHLELRDARLDRDDHVWTVDDGSGRELTFEVASTADPAFDRYRADPDLVAFAMVKLGEYLPDSGGLPL